MKKAIVSGLVCFSLVFVVVGTLMLPFGLATAGEANGKELFTKKCALCHGTDGVAKAMWAKQGARNFNDPAWQKEMTDDKIAKVVSDGVPDKKMPSYKAQLTPEEISAVIKHIRTLAPAK
jgi:mono/diheme cytochrome c family protein